MVIIEYNSLFGFEDAFIIPYDAEFIRGKNLPFSFYGTSLKAATLLARQKGYSLIGCNSAGNNSYFINDDYKQYVSELLVSVEKGYVFASFTEAWDDKGEPIRGLDKIHILDGQEVIDINNNAIVKFNATKVINDLIRSNKANRL